MSDMGVVGAGHRNVGFVEALSLFFKNYANFQGRSSRGAYWLFYVWYFIIIAVISTLGMFVDVIGYVMPLFGLAVIIPSIAVSVRRMHDIGKSGWWIFINLIPLVGFILWIVWAATPGQRATNRFGADVEAGK